MTKRGDFRLDVEPGRPDTIGWLLGWRWRWTLWAWDPTQNRWAHPIHTVSAGLTLSEALHHSGDARSQAKAEAAGMDFAEYLKRKIVQAEKNRTEHEAQTRVFRL